MKEAEGLKNKLDKCQNDNNFNTYVQLIKALRDTMELIKRYEWELKYSYKLTNSDGVAEISIWQENYEGETYRKRTWTVIDEVFDICPKCHREMNPNLNK